MPLQVEIMSGFFFIITRIVIVAISDCHSREESVKAISCLNHEESEGVFVRSGTHTPLSLFPRNKSVSWSSLVVDSRGRYECLIAFSFVWFPQTKLFLCSVFLWTSLLTVIYFNWLSHDRLSTDSLPNHFHGWIKTPSAVIPLKVQKFVPRLLLLYCIQRERLSLLPSNWLFHDKY